jgi:hypothetical protein
VPFLSSWIGFAENTNVLLVKHQTKTYSDYGLPIPAHASLKCQLMKSYLKDCLVPHEEDGLDVGLESALSGLLQGLVARQDGGHLLLYLLQLARVYLKHTFFIILSTLNF